MVFCCCVVLCAWEWFGFNVMLVCCLMAVFKLWFCLRGCTGCLHMLCVCWVCALLACVGCYGCDVFAFGWDLVG